MTDNAGPNRVDIRHPRWLQVLMVRREWPKPFSIFPVGPNIVKVRANHHKRSHHIRLTAINHVDEGPNRVRVPNKVRFDENNNLIVWLYMVIYAMHHHLATFEPVRKFRASIVRLSMVTLYEFERYLKTCRCSFEITPRIVLAISLDGNDPNIMVTRQMRSECRYLRKVTGNLAPSGVAPDSAKGYSHGRVLVRIFRAGTPAQISHGGIS